MQQGMTFSKLGKAIAGLSLLLAAACAYFEAVSFQRSASEGVAVWNNIGGCGSSGGGAAAGAGKWIGRGVSGGLVDVEALSNSTLGSDYSYVAEAVSSTLHFTNHPRYTLGMALAWKNNLYEYSGYKVNDDITPPVPIQIGGFGDLGLSANKIFGNENEKSFGISVSLPTGQHDVKRLHLKNGAAGTDNDDVRWANPFVQPGSGLYSLGVSYEYTKTKDWGLLIFGGSYTSSWAWDNWSCRDEVPTTGAAGNEDAKVLNCQTKAPSPLTWKLWELRHQDFYQTGTSWSNSKGAPGTGATGADGLSAYAYVGHTEESSTQSIGLTLSVPLSPTYYYDYGPGQNLNTAATTRVRTNDYTLKISGGIEITNPNFPVFISLGVPYRLNDIVSRGRLVDPQNYVGTIGIRGTFL